MVSLSHHLPLLIPLTQLHGQVEFLFFDTGSLPPIDLLQAQLSLIYCNGIPLGHLPDRCGLIPPSGLELLEIVLPMPPLTLCSGLGGLGILLGLILNEAEVLRVIYPYLLDILPHPEIGVPLLDHDVVLFAGPLGLPEVLLGLFVEVADAVADLLLPQLFAVPLVAQVVNGHRRWGHWQEMR